MARRKIRTISIPPDLDAKLASLPNENWSGVACRAFEVRVLELQAMHNTDKTKAAITRLRASKLRHRERVNAEAERAGVDYVLESAEYPEIERLARWAQEGGSLIEHLDDVAAILGGPNAEGDSRRAIVGKIEALAGGEADVDWCRAFLAAAAEQAHELRQQID